MGLFLKIMRPFLKTMGLFLKMMRTMAATPTVAMDPTLISMTRHRMAFTGKITAHTTNRFRRLIRTPASSRAYRNRGR